MAKLSLKDKVDLYEDTLKRIASTDVPAIESRALALAPDEIYKHAFALGWVRGELNDKVSDAQWALNQGAKK